MSSLKAKGIVVFSGGSAANNLVDVFKDVSNTRLCPLSYVIPISDNGGSSSELIRVFGGPGTVQCYLISPLSLHLGSLERVYANTSSRNWRYPQYDPIISVN